MAIGKFFKIAFWSTLFFLYKRIIIRIALLVILFWFVDRIYYRWSLLPIIVNSSYQIHLAVLYTFIQLFIFLFLCRYIYYVIKSEKTEAIVKSRQIIANAPKEYNDIRDIKKFPHLKK